MIVQSVLSSDSSQYVRGYRLALYVIYLSYTHTRGTIPTIGSQRHAYGQRRLPTPLFQPNPQAQYSRSYSPVTAALGIHWVYRKTVSFRTDPTCATDRNFERQNTGMLDLVRISSPRLASLASCSLFSCCLCAVDGKLAEGARLLLAEPLDRAGVVKGVQTW